MKQTSYFPVAKAIDRAVLVWRLNFSQEVFKMIENWMQATSHVGC